MKQQTPLESFIDYKANSNMQCGNYRIDLPALKENEQYRFHFDMSACIGCHCCEAACNEQNNNFAEVKWRRVGEMEAGVFPDVKQLFNSLSCNHCLDPECLKGCPTNSYIKFENGIVFHDDDLCIGCQYCTWNCPYEVPVFNKDRGIVTKCHMCYEKLEVGQTPACVQACPAGAIEIEVFDPREWKEEKIYEEGIAPHLPDISITKPTTRYTLPKYSGEVKPMDERLLKPAHSELPLVFMTVLTQISLGGFLAMFFGTLLSDLGFDLAKPGFILSLIVLLPAAFGLPLSALHLGRPAFAYRAMKNLKTSWLSREAAALGIYAAGAFLVTLLYLFDISKVSMLFIQFFVLSIGIYAIYAQSRIYRVAARASWNRKSTTLRFFATGYVGFLMTAFVMLYLSYDREAMAILAISSLFGLYQFYLIFEEIGFYKNLKKDDKNFYQLNRTKTLLFERFKILKNIRVSSLILFSVIAPIMSVVLIASHLHIIALSLLGFGILGAVFSELLGRYLFFVTVVPTGLAGNFFAGNQR